VIVVGACGGASATDAPAATALPQATDAPPAPATNAPAASPGASPDAGSTTPVPATTTPTANPAAAALAGKAWATAELTDVATGQPFRIADFAGRTVFVETMAIWCSNCRAQQGRFTEALGRLDPERVAYVVLTVEPSETADDLARYREKQGFAGTYAVAGRDMSAALDAEFGANVLNPPSVPVIVIAPDGAVSFRTGAESPDEIAKLVGG
jgi:hypothetical protein